MDSECPKSSKAEGGIPVDYQLYRKEPEPPDEFAARSTATISINELPAMVHRNIAALVAAQINLAGPSDFLFRIEQHFLPLRDPA